jgi:hypothetical protein
MWSVLWDDMIGQDKRDPTQILFLRLLQDGWATLRAEAPLLLSLLRISVGSESCDVPFSLSEVETFLHNALALEVTCFPLLHRIFTSPPGVRC